MNSIGTERYTHASEIARHSYMRDPVPEVPTSERYDPDLVLDIIALIWESSLSDTDKVELTFMVYEDIPAYGVLFETSIRYNGFSSEAQAVFWKHLRRFLGHENEALAQPAEYTLGVDFFEGSDTVDRAWAEVTGNEPTERRIQRVLRAGAVPFRLLRPLYAQLLPDERWHTRIFESLKYSYEDAEERYEVLNILEQLKLPFEIKGPVLVRHFPDGARER